MKAVFVCFLLCLIAAFASSSEKDGTPKLSKDKSSILGTVWSWIFENRVVRAARSLMSTVINSAIGFIKPNKEKSEVDEETKPLTHGLPPHDGKYTDTADSMMPGNEKTKKPGRHDSLKTTDGDGQASDEERYTDSVHSEQLGKHKTKTHDHQYDTLKETDNEEATKHGSYGLPSDEETHSEQIGYEKTTHSHHDSSKKSDDDERKEPTHGTSSSEEEFTDAIEQIGNENSQGKGPGQHVDAGVDETNQDVNEQSQDSDSENGHATSPDAVHESIEHSEPARPTSSGNGKLNLKPRYCDLLIIGAGAQATALLAQFATADLEPGKTFRIIIVEKGSKFGPGLAYDKDVVTDAHLLNLAYAFYIDIVKPPQPDDSREWLHHWLQSHPQPNFRIEDFGKQMVEYFRRSVVGEYLTDRFQKFFNESLKKGYEIELIPKATAFKVEDEGRRFLVKLSNGISVHTEDIFLATGHWYRSRFDVFVQGYFSSPWPASLLKNNITEEEDVGIFGSSHSAIDAALTLADMFGRFTPHETDGWTYEIPPESKFTMTMYSRSGQLPAVVGYMNILNVKMWHHTTPENLEQARRDTYSEFLPLDGVFELLKKDMAKFEQGRSAGYEDFEPYITNASDYWTLGPEDLLDRVDELIYFNKTKPKARLRIDIRRNKESFANEQFRVTAQCFLYKVMFYFNDLVRYFSAEDTIRFKERILPKLYKHNGIPLKTGQQLLALMKARRLAIVATEDTARITPGPGNTGVNISYGKDPNRVKVHHRYFIDAVGQSGQIEDDPSNLTQSLLSSQIIKPLYVRFDDDSVALELNKIQPDKVKQKSDGRFYYKHDGVKMNSDSNQAIGKYFFIRGTVYVSGPFVYGRRPYAQSLFVVTNIARDAVKDIKDRRFLIFADSERK